MSRRPHVETIEAHGCSIVLRRIEGPRAKELYCHCRPSPETADARGQAEAIYRALLGVLDAEGARYDSVVSETVFLRNLRLDIEPVRAARRGVLTATHGAADHRPAITEIEQAPLDERVWLEVSAQAVVSSASPGSERIDVRAACRCVECAGAHGLRLQLGEETRFHAAGLCGPGDDAYQQTLGMFELADALLRQAGMGFRDVVRTWIHLRHIDRDYAQLNRARRAFFAMHGIDQPPASTGIGGGPVAEGHDLCLGVYAVQSGRPAGRIVMTSRTLNEAADYGADFVRGLKVSEANKVALHVSGTASIDEHGRTAHVGDVDAQADRMLLNIAALLAGQGASFADVVSAITYLKHPADADRVTDRLRAAGFEGFPHALVAAPICRPDLLCETEALAVAPMG